MLARRDYAMLCVLYYTGIRRGELRRLRLRDIDLRNREMRIKGKGEKARTISFPRVLQVVLRYYLDQVRAATSSGDFVFCELDATTAGWVSSGSDADVTAGRYMTAQVREQARDEDDDYGLAPATLARRGNHWGRLAGVEGNHGPHRWRHGWASAAAQAGMPLEDIGAYLGHSLSKREEGLGWNPVTLDYIHLSADYLHQVVADALPDPLGEATAPA
jgi:integrase